MFSRSGDEPGGAGKRGVDKGTPPVVKWRKECGRRPAGSGRCAMEKQTLVEQITQRLLEMIQREGYGPGDKLPTETELVQHLGVGRNTVREALRSLASRNVVTVRQGAGTFISEKNGVADDPLGFAMMEDPEKLTRDLLQIRVMLEPPIAALAAQNRGEEDLERLRALLEEIEGRIARREEYAQLDSQFHAQIAVCSHNAVVSNLIPVITEGVRTFARTVAEPEYVQTLASHRAVYEAIREGRAADAQEEMLYHLLYNKKRYRHG